MEVLYDFGRLPVAGYLEPTLELAKNAPRFPIALALCTDCGYVQQAYDDGNQTLIDRVYSKYQPTYSMSARVSTYMESFLNRAISVSGAKSGDCVLEIGSNDGGLLHLLKERGLEPVGFEPSSNLAKAARNAGLDVVEDYFGEESARRFATTRRAQLMLTRHTLEHAFDPLDFMKGMAAALTDDGVAVIEVPYLRQQMINGHVEAMTFQHISFFSISSMRRALQLAGLELIDVVLVNMDGGSMVVYARRDRGGRSDSLSSRLKGILDLEDTSGMTKPDSYRPFFDRVAKMRSNIGSHLRSIRQQGTTVLGYGAGGKGQSLINQLGLDSSALNAVIDDVPGNAGQFVPGTDIPVIASSDPIAAKADFIFLTAPTHVQEIMQKEGLRTEAGTTFLTTIPDFQYAPLSKLH